MKDLDVDLKYDWSAKVPVDEMIIIAIVANLACPTTALTLIVATMAYMFDMYMNYEEEYVFSINGELVYQTKTRRAMAEFLANTDFQEKVS
jgi:hypothetical protein